MLYDVGAGPMCGHGTWGFEAYPTEHTIVEQTRAAIVHDEFCEYFADVYG